MARSLVGFLLALALATTARPAASGLAESPSAFLRANADSPVGWLPWGDAAFTRARTEQKPVFLAVGAFTSELSRAMTRQSFANAETAALLHDNFICILVDREEHPEVAALYLNYVRTVKQLDGAPLNIWLTPELTPFEGAAYLPPSEEWGKSSFLKTARQAVDAWKADPAACRKRAAEAVALVADPGPALPATGPAPEKIREKLTAAAAAWLATADATHGGFGDPPRNPEPELLRFLLRESPEDRAAALATFRAMAASALRDPLDGGFFHSASDPAWHLPYPQKFLADQARVALAYLDAAQAAPDPVFSQAARGALDYVLSRLAQPDGTFAAGEDATGDEFAGYYAWTAAEIDTALGADAAAFKLAHGVAPAGNLTPDDDTTGRYQGKNLLRAAVEPDAASASRLRAVRDRRPPPPRDERATAGAHGLLIAALARAGHQLHEPRYLEAAARTLAAVKKHFLGPDGELHRLRDSALPGDPADYTALALGCRELAKAGPHPDADALATRLLARCNELYFDAAHGRYLVTTATLPAGIFARVPALGDVPPAEALALLAGPPAAEAEVLKAALAAQVEDNGVPIAGGILLGLAP